MTTPTLPQSGGQVTLPILDPTQLNARLQQTVQIINDGWELLAQAGTQELREEFERNPFWFQELARGIRSDIAQEEENIQMGTAALEAAGC